MTDICENEDGAKVAHNMGAGCSHPQGTLSPQFDEREKEVKAPAATTDSKRCPPHASLSSPVLACGYTGTPQPDEM